MNTNLVILQGNLGGDVELRHTTSGKAVANLSIAINSGFGDKKKTDWFRVTLWESLAEQAQQNLGKGSEVTVIGRLTNKKKDDKWVTEVVGTSIGYGEIKAGSGKTEDEDDSIPF